MQLVNEQIIASENEPVQWTTPLGLPVVQPYRKLGRKFVSAGRFCIVNKSHEYLLTSLGINYSFKGIELNCLLNFLQIKTSLQILTIQRETEKVLYLYISFWRNSFVV